MRIVLASGNRYKFEEFESFFCRHGLIARSGLELVSAEGILDKKNIELPDVEETGSSYEENAFIKASAWANLLGIPAMADDSGLEVEALSWGPGIRSARAAPGSDEKRISWLLGELEGVEDRRACFVANIVIAFPIAGLNAECAGRGYFSIEGRCWGSIADKPSGNEGFGYDPVFLPSGHSMTFAQMTRDEKLKISHRAVAMNGMAQILPSVIKYFTVQNI